MQERGVGRGVVKGGYNKLISENTAPPLSLRLGVSAVVNVETPAVPVQVAPHDEVKPIPVDLLDGCLNVVVSSQGSGEKFVAGSVEGEDHIPHREVVAGVAAREIAAEPPSLPTRIIRVVSRVDINSAAVDVLAWP